MKLSQLNLAISLISVKSLWYNMKRDDVPCLKGLRGFMLKQKEAELAQWLSGMEAYITVPVIKEMIHGLSYGILILQSALFDNHSC